MNLLEKIQYPVKDQMQHFDQFVAGAFTSDNQTLNQMLIDAISSRGKGVRPLLVYLTMGVSGGSDESRGRIAAFMVEMIHLSSLIHDDVLDDAPTRRGKPSVNALWQSKRAVLTGDYILARNLMIGLESGHTDIVRHVVAAIATLCEGEVMQDDLARRLTSTREEYLRVIAKKTASLLSISCSVGGICSNASIEKIELLAKLGYNFGMAFQIQDDILDFRDDANSGKSPYQDLIEGKITLPLLLPLELVSEQERAVVLTDVERCNVDSDSLGRIIDFIGEYNGVELASAVMEGYLEESRAILAQFEDSIYNESLALLCDFIGRRNY